MENLFGTVATYEPSYLLSDNENTNAIGISIEPKNGVIPAGAVLYRKSGVLYAPAAAANIVASNNLVVLRDEVDTTTSETVAAAAAAYREGHFKAGRVLVKGTSDYEAVTAAQAVVLRGQNIELNPFDNWDEDPVEADNTVSTSSGSGD